MDIYGTQNFHRKHLRLKNVIWNELLAINIF